MTNRRDTATNEAAGAHTCQRDHQINPLQPEAKLMTDKKTSIPRQEHSVPWFWPLAAAIEMQEEGLQFVQNNMRYLAEAERIEMPPTPDWATSNRIILELDTLRLRDFSQDGVTDGAIPVLVDAPHAGHSSTIADYAKGQSLVETLLETGLKRVLVTDWKSATGEMRDFDIDKYLAEINIAVDDLGGVVNLVGLCQGGWMSAMRPPSKRLPRSWTPRRPENRH